MVVGIYTGIYDEDYIKMAIGTAILDFYKMYANILVNNESYRNERFMALEKQQEIQEYCEALGKESCVKENKARRG